MPVADAEREWRAFLSTVELPPEGLALAQLRFRRGAIFSQVCPHAVAALMSELGGALASGDDEGALETCARILSIDHGDAVTRARRAAVLARAGSIDEAEAELASLEGASPPILALARTGIADALWQRGERARAAAMYRALLEEPAGEDDLRQLEVKLLGVEGDAETDAALRELLAPRGATTHDAATTISAIGRLRAARSDGLADYLEARQLAGRERYDLAAPMIARARAHGLPTPRVTREARRVDAIARYGAGDREGSRALCDEIASDPTSSEAMRVEARDWLARIEWRAAAR
jgi:tetratricopeptide (TPR) repeat protein